MLGELVHRPAVYRMLGELVHRPAVYRMLGELVPAQKARLKQVITRWILHDLGNLK